MPIRLISQNGTDAYSMPVTMAEMAEHLKREDTVEDDEYINACLLAATEWAEIYTGKVMVDSTFDLTVDNFPTGPSYGPGATSTIYLRRSPVLSVTSVTYRDVGGADVVLDASGYAVDLVGDSIYLPLSATWPSTDGAANGVTIRFRAGFINYATYPPTVGNIPHTLRAAIKLKAAEFYANRDNELDTLNASRVPYGCEELLRFHRIDDSLA